MRVLWYTYFYMKRLITHNAGFHADDVVAYAILQLVLDKKGETYELIRSRDESVIKTGDIVFDIGNIYDPLINRYDHHQVGRAGSRENGIHYAAAGLVWKHFGMDLCLNERVWSDIDRFFIAPLDAIDNGQSIIKEFNFENIGTGNLAGIIGSFVPSMYEDESPESVYAAFIEISTITKRLLERSIQSQNDLEKIYQDLYTIYQSQDDKQIIISDKNVPRPIMSRFAELPEPLFITYPDSLRTMYKAEVVCKSPGTFEARVPFPSSWAGLRDTQLQEICGVSDALFAHPGQFLVGARSLEGVQQMVVQALEHYQKNQ